MGEKKTGEKKLPQIAYDELLHEFEKVKGVNVELAQRIVDLTKQNDDLQTIVGADRRLVLEKEVKDLSILGDEDIAKLSMDELAAHVKAFRLVKQPSPRKGIHFTGNEIDNDPALTVGDMFEFHLKEPRSAN